MSGRVAAAEASSGHGAGRGESAARVCLAAMLWLWMLPILPPGAAAAPAPGPRQQTQQESTQPAPSKVPEKGTEGRGQRLIMKDGTDQLVKTYQVEGDKVRFYSVERSEWEEIPAAMVDWEATKKAEAARTQRDALQLAKVKKSEAERKADPMDVDASIELGPGVFLPPGEGLFAYDGKAVLPLAQAQTTVKLDKKRLIEQIMSPVPVVPSKHNVMIPGRAAALRLHSADPEFYFRTTNAAEPQLKLLQVKVKGDNRIVESKNTLITATSTSAREIPVQFSSIAAGLYRLTPSQSLAPGEYAIAGQMLPGAAQESDLIWDFGVDAPADSGKRK